MKYFFLVILLALSLKALKHSTQLKAAEQPHKNNGTHHVANPLWGKQRSLRASTFMNLGSALGQTPRNRTSSSVPITETTPVIEEQENFVLTQAPVVATPTLLLYEEDITWDRLAALRKQYPSIRSLEIRQREQANTSTLIPTEIQLVAEHFPEIFTITALSIHNFRVPDATLNALAYYMPNLELFESERAGIKTKGAYLIAEKFPHLRSLNLAGNALGNEGIYALSQAPFATQLYALNVSATNSTAESIPLFGNFSHLRVLNMGDNKFGKQNTWLERLLCTVSKRLKKLIVSLDNPSGEELSNLRSCTGHAGLEIQIKNFQKRSKNDTL